MARRTLMRILLLAQFFPPDIGGEERHVFNLANTLAGRGHEVAVATQRQSAVDHPVVCVDNMWSLLPGDA